MVSPSIRTLSIAALITTAAGYSLLGVGSRLLDAGLEPMTQVYLRILLGWLLAVVLFHSNIRWDVVRQTSRHDWFWLLIMGVVGYSVSVFFLTLGNLNAKLVNASVIYATIPFVVYAYSYVLLREPISPRLIVLLLLSLLGIGMISSHSFVPTISGFGKGEAFVLIATFLAGWWSVGRKMLSERLNNTEISLIVMAIAWISGLILALVKGESLEWSAFTMPSVQIGLVIGASMNIVATFFENFAFKHLDVVFANQLLMSSTVFSLVLGWLLYQEYISWPELLGALLIVVSVYGANRVLSSPAT